MDIRDYGLISDCQSGALVSSRGSIDWLCLQRFDSPSIFGRLLGEDAGEWSLAPVADARVSREYIPDTLVLKTRFDTEEGSVEVVDAMAFRPGARGHEIGLASPHVVLRRVRGLSGSVAMRCRIRPRPEYGIARPLVRATDDGVVEAAAGATTLRFEASVPLEAVADDAAISAEFTIAEGQRAYFAMEYQRTFSAEAAVAESPGAPWHAALEDGLAGGVSDTIAAWRSWAVEHWGPELGYRGPYLDRVRLSSLVLQGLTYQPSGAIVAALTTSVPERPAGEWNWDYRYAWLRDASMVMRALWIAACPSEPEALFSWIAVAAGYSDASAVQIVYGVEGERDLSERELGRLTGFNASTPVRVGNGAWTQRQLDVPGEVLDAAHQLDDKLESWSSETAELMRSLADFAAAHWREPDAGMWEARDRLRHYTSSKVMSWVALDRAITLASRIGASEEQVSRWEGERLAVYSAVIEEGWVEEKRAFAGAFGSDHLDASVLLMPIVGFLPVDDPRVLSTIDAVERELGAGPLIRRWPSEPSGFLLTSYWMVQCLALTGQVERARERFEAIDAYANDLGLLAEEGDPVSGEPLGNFPQVFSHVGLINAAWDIAQAERRKEHDMGQSLEGRVALVTGSDSGLGQATAVEFASRGADVVVTYFHDRGGAEETRQRVEAAGHQALVTQVDVREEASVEAMFDAALERFGKVDILVNNAGVDASGKRVHELDTATWDNAMKTNLYGYFFCARRFVQERLKDGDGAGGKIVNITSIHSEHPRAGAADYDASKAGEEELGDTLAIELADKGINVVNVAPGWVLTPFNQPDIDDPKKYEEDAKTVPMGRAASPEEIAKTIAFVVSEDAAYMTGTTVTVDGGLSINQGTGA